MIRTNPKVYLTMIAVKYQPGLRGNGLFPSFSPFFRRCAGYTPIHPGSRFNLSENYICGRNALGHFSQLEEIFQGQIGF